MTKQPIDKIQIDLGADVLVKANARAHTLSMTLSQYVQFLIDKDISSKENESWLEPIPKEVDEQWEMDLAETEDEEDRSGLPRKTYHSADDYIKDILDST